MPKKDFPFFSYHPELIFVDNAALTQKPLVVLESMNDFYAKKYAPAHRSFYALAEESTQLVEDARLAVASFIGAVDASEIIFTKNSTEAINIVAYAWIAPQLSAGDEIVITDIEHHSNSIPWKIIAESRGAILKVIRSDDQFFFSDDTLNLITHRTKLVAITLSSNVVGYVDESYIHKLIKAAHAVGANILCDAAQIAGHYKIDVKSLGCTFLVASSDKMFGPSGIGILYARQLVHDQCRPFFGGGGVINGISAEGTIQWKPVPYVLEGGSVQTPLIHGLAVAVKYLEQKMAQNNILHIEEQLIDRLIRGFYSLPAIHMLTQSATKNHILSFFVEGVHSHDIAAYCAQYNICVRGGMHCSESIHKKRGIKGSVRISVAHYNTITEMEKILEVVERLLKNASFF